MTGVDVAMSAGGVLWVVVCSSDNTLKLWKRESPENGRGSPISTYTQG